MIDEMEDLQVTFPGAGTFTFSDDKVQSDALLALVRAGKKTANCAALADFDDDPEALPKVGRHDIAANWDGTPALIIRTISVQNTRFCDITEALALTEGEDDTLDAWRKRHEVAFRGEGRFDNEMMLVFETFELVEDLADR
ncbi:ASCH domain-containing protein [Thalassovita sp.]|uniref:ASCH domain-containing protein n=1 Tax=Thalassovita sp. TaxID=1979401 RepID=UPI002B26A088|nr:ASCH domain-containing protein [Thalassovita sp.]